MKLKEIIQSIPVDDFGFCHITPETLELMVKRFAVDNMTAGLDLQELTLRYFGAVDRVASDIETKTAFHAEEICSMIYDIIKEKADQPENTYSVMFAGTHYDGAYLDCEQIEGVLDKFNEYVQIQQCLGETDPVFDDRGKLLVTLSKVSHLVTEIWFDMGVLYARIKVLPTPMGEALNKSLTAGEMVFRPRMYYHKMKYSGEGAEFLKIRQIITIDAIRKELDPFKL